MSSSDRPSFRRMVLDCVIVSRRRSLFVPVMLSFSAGPASKALSAAICLQNALEPPSSVHLELVYAERSHLLHSSWLPGSSVARQSPSSAPRPSSPPPPPPPKVAGHLETPW